MNIPDFNQLSFKAQTEKYLSKHYPEFLDMLHKKYGYDMLLKEKIYLYVHNMDGPGVCKVCGMPTKFNNSIKGYFTYCSPKCSNSDPDKKLLTKSKMESKYGVVNPSQLDSVKEKKKQTSLKNWGVSNPSQSSVIQDKFKETMLERYGVEYPSQSSVIQDKFKETMLERYGVEHPSQLDSVKEKKKQTSLKNWGVEHPSQLDSVKEKKKQTSLKNWGVESPMLNNDIKSKVKISFNKTYMQEHPDVLSIVEHNGERIYTCNCTDNACNLCAEKQYLINSSLYHSRNYQMIEKCTIKNPIDHKSKDTSIELFIRDILDLHQISYISNYRAVGNLELDIFIPSKNIGIECNGIYWHSDKIKLPKYHYMKYKTYKDANVQLISIWEDWIKNKPDIVKSMVLSKLGIYGNRIYARKCTISPVPHQDCKDFLEKNHIQGNSNSSVRLGLYYGNTLVSIMCFSKKRRNMMGKSKNDQEWELTRFCNLSNTQIIGAASKLLKYFTQLYNPEKIVSFASHDISNGKIYELLGFEIEKDTCGSYWYVDDRTLIRYHRYCFRKSELIKLGYDRNESEFTIMNNLPYTRIYDSGQSKYVWYKKRDTA